MTAGRRDDRSQGPVLPDLLGPGLAVVFCGTGAGRRSAEVGAYYAGPGNRFWQTLHDTGLTPRRFRPEEFRELLSFGIGLTDIAKRHVGADAVIDPAGVDPIRLAQRVVAVAPRCLAFTSKKAASLYFGRPTVALAYGLQPEGLGPTAIHVLPSPSGAARGAWSSTPWHALAEAASGR